MEAPTEIEEEELAAAGGFGEGLGADEAGIGAGHIEEGGVQFGGCVVAVEGKGGGGSRGLRGGRRFLGCRGLGGCGRLGSV